MSRKYLAITLATAALALATTACSSGSSTVAADCKPAHNVQTITQGTLTVGVYDLPPYISTQGEGGMSGIDADIIRRIAAIECLEVKPQAGSAAALVPGVQANRLDVTVGDWYRTEARAQITNLTDPIYLDDMGIVSSDGLNTVAGLQGKTVGTVDGYLWVSDLQKLLGDSLKIYPAGANMQQDLKAGRIQVGIDSYGSATNTLRDTPNLKVVKAQPDPRVAASVQPAQVGWPLPKQNPSLLEAFNADLAQLRQNGTLVQILTQNGLEASAADVGAPRLIGN